MRELLATRGIQLTKSLGQNFLHDANQLRRIVEAAELEKADKILEIGPGLGPLTEWLLEKAGEVLAIEKDLRLVEFLRERFNVAQASRLHNSTTLLKAGGDRKSTRLNSSHLGISYFYLLPLPDVFPI